MKNYVLVYSAIGRKLESASPQAKRSLNVSRLRCELLLQPVPDPKDRNEIIAELDNILMAGGLTEDQSDYVHAKACRAYVRMQKFFGKHNEKVGEWDKIEDDVRKALELDPTHYLAGTTYCWLRLAEYSLWPILIAPSEVKKTSFYKNRIDVAKTAVLLRQTTEKLTINYPDFWKARAHYLYRAAEDLARAGGNQRDGDAATIRDYLDQAALATKKAQSQRELEADTYTDTVDLANIAASQALHLRIDFKTKLQEALTLYDISPKKVDHKVERAKLDKARTVIRAVHAELLPKEMLKTIGDELSQVIEKASKPEIKTEAMYWQAVRTAVAEAEWATVDKAFREVIESGKDQAATPQNWLLQARIWQVELALNERVANKTNGEAEKVYKDALESLSLDVKKSRPDGQSPDYYSFVPDYLSGRAELLAGNTKAAAAAFANAHEAIANADKQNTLRVEWPWAVRCLTWEINECPNEFANADDLAKRKEYLKQLRSRFGWSLSNSDSGPINRALR